MVHMQRKVCENQWKEPASPIEHCNGWLVEQGVTRGAATTEHGGVPRWGG